MIKVEVGWCDGVAPFCFATTVELTAIAKSCVEREKSLGKIAQGDKLSLCGNITTTCGRIAVIILGLYH